MLLALTRTRRASIEIIRASTDSVGALLTHVIFAEGMCWRGWTRVIALVLKEAVERRSYSDAVRQHGALL